MSTRPKPYKYALKWHDDGEHYLLSWFATPRLPDRFNHTCDLYQEITDTEGRPYWNFVPDMDQDEMLTLLCEMFHKYIILPNFDRGSDIMGLTIELIQAPEDDD